MRTLAAFLAISLLSVGSLSAQRSAADCADLEDDRARLECYDRFFSGEGRPTPEAEAEAETEAERPAPSRSAGSSTRSRPESRASRTASASRRQPEPPSSPEDRFGRDQSMLDMGGEEMSTRAVGSFDYWREGQRIELSNGQVWEITNDTDMYHKVTNPEVTIEKGFFSSYYLHVDGVSKALRVRRVR